jgi:hypothetical protein
VPYIEAIKLLRNITKISEFDDVIIRSNTDSYKQSTVFASYLNEERDQNESGYIEKKITINGTIYSLHYRRGTA